MDWWTPTRSVEAAASAFGVVCVALTVRQSLWCWPTGIVMVSLYGWIFWQVRLYSGMALQAIYLVLNVYGWVHWQRGSSDGSLPVSRLSPHASLGWLAAALAGGGALGFSMRRWTDADLAYADALATALSLVAQYLMARKALENWLFWIAVNVLSIAIYAWKSLWLTSGLYLLLLGIATAGFFTWRRSIFE